MVVEDEDVVVVEDVAALEVSDVSGTEEAEVVLVLLVVVVVSTPGAGGKPCASEISGTVEDIDPERTAETGTVAV